MGSSGRDECEAVAGARQFGSGWTPNQLINLHSELVAHEDFLCYHVPEQIQVWHFLARIFVLFLDFRV
jgi:hypothetical protein